MTDKLRDAVLQAIDAANKAIASRSVKFRQTVLENLVVSLGKALQPEPEFYFGQLVVLNSGAKGCYMHRNRYTPENHLIALDTTGDCIWTTADQFGPDPDWQPPGFLKKPDRNEIWLGLETYLAKKVRIGELVVPHAVDYFLSLWPQED